MRTLQISWVLARYTLFYHFTRHREKKLGQRLKLAFEELGIAFVKIGQVLSMRYDLLSDEDCTGLQELLDNVAPLPIGTINEILDREYAGLPQPIFKTFIEKPLGSASVSQVHKAQLPNGKWVAVKIKRPGVDRMFLTDVAILRRVARIAQWFSPTLRHIQLTELVNYFEGWIEQDLDFTTEVKNMKKIGEQYSFATTAFRPDLGRGVFPAPFEHLSTENIIVMDFIDGIPMSRKEEILANPDYDAEKSIISYVSAAMRNWFRDDHAEYLFQADPHLSNIIAMPHGDAASIDYGLISSLSPKESRLCQDLIIAVYVKDVEAVLKLGARMTGVTYEEYDSATMRADVVRYLEQTTHEGLGFWFLEFVKIIVKHRLKFPLFLTTFGRTNIILDGLVHAYMPEKTTLDIFGKELRRQAVKEIIKNLADADWLRLGYSLGKRIKESPDAAGSIVDDPLGFLSEIARAVRA